MLQKLPRGGTAAAILAVLCCSPLAARARAEYINYAIGNSLTADLLLADAFDSTGKGTQHPSDTGDHIRCGSSLTNIVANPDDVCVVLDPTFGKYQTVLPRDLNNVFLQPFYGSTVRSEITAIKSLIGLTQQNAGNADTRFFVYASWAQKPDSAGETFLAAWEGHVATLDDDFVPSRSTYDLVMRTLWDDGYEVALIPAGHTFAAIAKAMENGAEITAVEGSGPGVVDGKLTADGLYRDGLHASNAGKYAAAVSAFAAVYGQDPTGQTVDPIAFSLDGYGAELTAEGARQVQSIAWQTYQNAVAVPEPASAFAVAVPALALWLCRRRSVKASAA